jgi:hypothetical protein
MSPRWIALVMLVTVGGLVAGCAGVGSPDETSVTPPAVPISITRTGGIAGVNQTIQIGTDGTWTYTDNRKNQRETGTLGADQRLQVLRFVTDPAFAAQLSKAAKPDSGCADGFHYTISTGGESSSFEDCGTDDRPTVKAAIAAITEATAF